ncbi:DUF1330 domain-containing protein [Woeseiaceae bacterium]|mgnify:CR=1 FL=1|jgi:uncharacterized protein (DUF1330 family)|nr:DUF1330 domain-containing protein [Woeseiaceae bacterium]|tara:strand:- start:283 stop:612 length:330 start_codon:yes stop_codon:yes gene_type:complete
MSESKSSETMNAYMIIACKMHDREAFINGYGKAVPLLVEKYGGKYLVVAPGAVSLEGTLKGYSSVAISRWPSKQVALDFWYSEEYLEVKKLRENLADVEVLLVEAPEIL